MALDACWHVETSPSGSGRSVRVVTCTGAVVCLLKAAAEPKELVAEAIASAPHTLRVLRDLLAAYDEQERPAGDMRVLAARALSDHFDGLEARATKQAAS